VLLLAVLAPMDIRPLRLSGTFEILLQPKPDQRGYFMRAYDEVIFGRNNLNSSWVQENQAVSLKKGVIRGLHFQKPPHAETKFVRVVYGAVLDAFVDLRRNSPTYGQWETVVLSEDSHNAIYIPKGFAHGYCTITEKSIVLYKVDAPYAPGSEDGLRWNDEDIAIPWPVDDPIVSAKDACLPFLREFVTPFDWEDCRVADPIV
jgi:dTDP-4-dehydrorhamnose 3,5-epimerase